MQPKEWLVEGHRTLFGDTDDVSWRSAHGFFEHSERAAARRQHVAAMLVNRHLKGGGVSQESLSRRLGRGEDHVGRKLRGEQWADVRDLAEWARAFGDPEILGGGSAVAEIASEHTRERDLPPDPKVAVPGSRGGPR